MACTSYSAEAAGPDGHWLEQAALDVTWNAQYIPARLGFIFRRLDKAIQIAVSRQYWPVHMALARKIKVLSIDWHNRRSPLVSVPSRARVPSNRSRQDKKSNFFAPWCPKISFIRHQCHHHHKRHGWHCQQTQPYPTRLRKRDIYRH